MANISSTFGFSHLGINALVEILAPDVYEKETPLSVEHVVTLAAAAVFIQRHKPSHALGGLSIFGDDLLRDNASLRMRYHFLCGLAHKERAVKGNIRRSPVRYFKAQLAFKESLTIATDWNDVRSQIVLNRLIGDTEHELKRYDGAIDYYVSALNKSEGLDFVGVEAAPAQIELNTLLSRQHYIVGNIARSQAYLDTARRLLNQFGARARSDRAVSNIAWMEMLLFRASSRFRGGDLELQRQALDRFVAALRRIESMRALTVDDPKRDPQIEDAYARLQIQAAEIYIDRAQTYRQRGNTASYTNQMLAAQNTAILASGVIKGYSTLQPSAEEVAPRLLALTIVRHDFTSLTPQAIAPLPGPGNAHDLLRRIIAIEEFAEKTNDELLMAHAATLEGDVLAAAGQPGESLAALYNAMAAYHESYAAGESTRARYLILKALDLV